MLNSTGEREVLHILKRSAIFHGMETRRIREQFLPAMKLLCFRKQPEDQQFLTRDYFYILISGMVHGFLTDRKTERKISLFVLREGDGFDVLNLLGGHENMVSYACLQREVKCLAVPLLLMQTWARQEPEIAKSLLTYMGHLLVVLEELVFDLSVSDTGTRLVKLLLKYARTPLEKNHGTPVLHHLTHEELASLIGSVRVVVSRQVRKLKKMSLIEAEKGKIIIKDMKTLIEVFEKSKRKIEK